MFSGDVQGLQTFSTCDDSHLVVTHLVFCCNGPCRVFWLHLYTGDLQTVILEIFSNHFFLKGQEYQTLNEMMPR